MNRQRQEAHGKLGATGQSSGNGANAPATASSTLFKELTLDKPWRSKTLYFVEDKKEVGILVAEAVGMEPAEHPAQGCFSATKGGHESMKFLVVLKVKDGIGLSITGMARTESDAQALWGLPGLKMLGGTPEIWIESAAPKLVARRFSSGTSKQAAQEAAALYAQELMNKMAAL